MSSVVYDPATDSYIVVDDYGDAVDYYDQLVDPTFDDDSSWLD